jgi:uncharacterized protein
MKENTTIVARKNEVARLRKLLTSKESELVAVLGRRRVGKTFLVKQVYAKEMLFKITGLEDAPKKEQLENFAIALSEAKGQKDIMAAPKTWVAAFQKLKEFIEENRTNEKKVIFFDELPWLASIRSGFIQAFDNFWNSWAVDKNLIVVICGSAATWMITNIIDSNGGLHNRVTKKIHLDPFTLTEVEKYFKSKAINLPRYEIASLYMALGGIPYYIKEVEKGDTAATAIDRICFGKKAHLYGEFNKLYKALFKNYEDHIAVVKALAKKHKGLSRNELLGITKLASGGGFSLILRELEESSFITSYKPFGKKERDTLYRLTDEYSLFYLDFIEKNSTNEGIWLKQYTSTSVKTWNGYVFESLCMKHIAPIKKMLGISGIYTEESSFFHSGNSIADGFQIDLLIDRNDNAINLCEMKFYNTEYVFTADNAKKLRQKKANFIALTNTKKQVITTLITTYGLTLNAHSSIVDNCLKLDALFE